MSSILTNLINKTKDITNKVTTSTTSSLITTDYLLYILLFGSVLYIVIMLLVKPYFLFSQTNIIILIILTVLIIVIKYFNYFTTDVFGQIYAIYSSIIAVIIIIISIYLFTSTGTTIGNYMSMYIVNILFVFGLLIGLALVYSIGIEYINKVEGWPGFILNIILFIPCLINELIDFVLQDYASTANVVFILFILEILVIISYLYLPKMVNNLMKHNGIQILSEIRYLNRPMVIGNNSIYPKIIDKQVSYNNFALSLWLNTGNILVQQNKYIPIFTYGSSPNIMGHPSLNYGYNNQLNIVFSNHDNANTTYMVTISPQKWNNLVFNYNNNGVDLFINGKLFYSTSLINMLPIYDIIADKFYIGTNNMIDNSAICNIVYYKQPLTLLQITQNYNLLHTKNPPLNY